MADLRTMFGAVMLVVLASLFVATMFSQSLANGGYTDTGEFPLAHQAEIYSNQTTAQSIQLQQSLNATFGQQQNVDLTNSFFATASTAGQAMSIVWSSLLMVTNMFGTIIASPIMANLGIQTILVGIGTAYIVGLIALIILGVVLKWFI